MNSSPRSGRRRAIALGTALAVAGTLPLVGARPGARAQGDDPVEIVSREGTVGGPWAEPAESPSIAVDGSIVVFDGVRDGVPTVAVRDRHAAATSAVPGVVTRNGAVSGDGCIVAYVDAPDDAGPWQPTVRDRCAGVTSTVGAPVTEPLPVPGVSADGGLVVWSTGDALLAVHRDGDAYVGAAAPAGLPPGAEIGPRVDVAADGSVVVLTATSGAGSQVHAWLRDPADPADPGSLELVSVVGVDPADGDSTSPSVSADGTLVVFETTSTGLAGTATIPAVVVRDRVLDVTRVVAADATAPDLSGDGTAVAFVRGGEVRLATSGDGAPFEAVDDELVAVAVDADDPAAPLPAPAVSGDGSRVAFASDQGPSFTAEPGFATGTHVWLRDRARLHVGAIDFGDVTLGTTADRSASVTNAGAVGIAVGAPSAPEPFSVVASTCGGVLVPGASCTVTVRFTPAATTTVATGALTIGDAFDPTRVASGELTGRGVVAATTTPAPPSSTTSTLPSTTVPPTTSPVTTQPRTSLPRYQPPRRSPPRRTTVTTPRRPTSTTTFGDASLSFSPQLVVLDPVVAGTGRATSVVALTNVGTASTTVSDVTLDASSAVGFVVDAATCLGAFLAPGDACQIAVEFTAAAVGPASGLLVATADDGATATVELSAEAVEPPVLAAGPDVAAPGQVVTVTGDGFPSGEELTLQWGGDTVAVTTDAAGSFRLPLVVMRHTSSGPFTVRVEGVPERFPATDAALLVRSAGARASSPAVRPSAGNPIGG